MSTNTHFLSFCDFHATRILQVIDRGLELKQQRIDGHSCSSLADKVMAMLFMQPSTRTRISFEAGMAQLGGATVYLAPDSMQLSRGESIEDTARVIAAMCDIAVVRTPHHEFVQRFAAVADIPVINALTAVEHPCQVLADVMTFIELRGAIAGRKVAWIGDCNNVCRSWMHAANVLGFEFVIATPPDYAPAEHDPAVGTNVTIVTDPMQAVPDAACVVTDVWYGMGDDQDKERRLDVLSAYTVDDNLMAQAAPDAIFMHCLPAHRGEEVTATVIDGDQSVVWIEAENRLHVQKALLEDLLINRPV